MAVKDYRRITYSIFFVVLVIIAIASYRWIFYYRSHTRDAYTYANVVSISSLVSGHVWHIYVRDNEHVKKGQKLFELDPRPFRYRYHQAKANFKDAMVSYDNAKKRLRVAEEDLAERKKSLAEIQQHVWRFKKLSKEGAIPEIRYIDIDLSYKREAAAVRAAENDVLISKRDVNLFRVEEAEAELNIAKYNLDHSVVRSPSDGYVTNFFMRKGEFARRGQAMFALVETNVWWVIGRMRETVLRRVRVGDKVKIKIDMYPGVDFHGVVESIGWGVNRRQASTSAAKSSLPYLKLTEDWIRIAQRFPVRVRLIDLSPKYPLRVGGNAHVYVVPDNRV